VTVAGAADAFVLPSVDEAFGVAYVEAMAAGVPAIGSRGEAGPEEIAAAGGGILLVPPGEVDALTAQIDGLLADPSLARELGRAARANVEAAFTWERCGRDTVAAYEAALR
jgi:glycosyltransferase involved in cell wall biosynthesis